MCVVLRFALATLLFTHGLPAHAMTDLATLDAARFVASQSPLPPQDAGTAIALPDPWVETRPEFTGPAWYLLDWMLADEPTQTFGLYLTTTTLPAEVFVNGVSIGSTGALTGRRPRSWEVSQAFVLPDGIVRAGHNRIAVRVYSAAPGVGAFGRIETGPASSIRAQAYADLIKYVVAPALVSVTMIVVGLLIVVLWTRRRDPSYLLFGSAAMIWGLHTATSLLPAPLLPQPHWAVWWHVVYLAFVGLLCLFCLRFAGVTWRPYRNFVIAFTLALAPLLYASSRLDWLGEATTVARFVGIAMVVVALAAVARYAIAIRNAESVLLFVTGAISTAFAVHDFMAAQDPYQIRPLWLVPYASLAFLMLVGWILVDRFVRALNVAERANAQLEQRVTEKSAALAAQLAQTRLARDDALAANRAKSRFLAAASHDLRQPLHALGLFAGALNERVRDAGDAALVRKINTTVESLDTLLSALLDVSKLDAGAIVPRIQPTPIDPLFERIANDFAPEAIERNLRLAVVPTRASVLSDPVLFERVLRNLVANALRYTTSGGVVVGCRRRRGRLCVEVRDTGPGIPDGEQARIFEEFYQIGNPERDRTHGLGLGLAIVQRLCDLLGHTIELNSAPGRGSTFRVCMEPARTPPSVEQATPADARLTPLQQRTIVVVDDEAPIREGMRELLATWGCAAIVAADAEEAIALARNGPAPDALLVDYRLREGLDGVRAIEQMRCAWGKDVPAVLISGASSPEDLARIKASGLVLLHKPLMPAKLRSALAFVLARANPPA
ncbi:MAG: ATP-binding protein [Casimicrobiaceae bacterium]